MVWPYNKPLPEDIDYIIDYEIFLPSYIENQTRSLYGLNTETLQILENEAINLALGLSIQTKMKTRSNTVRTLTGTVSHYDNLIENYVPIQNLKIEFKLGSNIWDTYTQSNGYFSITNLIPLEASVSCTFHHPKWKITYENSTSPITIPWGITEQWWKNSSNAQFRVKSTTPQYEIHRAVNFYFNGSHAIRTWSYDSGIRIRAIDRTNDETNAYFSYSKKIKLTLRFIIIINLIQII